MTLTDDFVLSLVQQLEEPVPGSYSEVWRHLVGLVAPFSHFRALQLARVGRSYEDATGVPFTTVFPDLPDTASDWTSNL